MLNENSRLPKKKEEREREKKKKEYQLHARRGTALKGVFQKKIQVCNAICYFYEDLREINFLSQETGNRKY